MAVARANAGHKAAFDKDYSTKSAKYGPVVIEMLTDNAEQEISAIMDRLEDDKELMGQIAEKMRAAIEAHIASGPGPALKESTVKRKKLQGWGPTPLLGSGTLKRGIVARSRKHFASARREKGTSSGLERSLTFAFLHDLGVGRMEARPFMFLDAGEMTEIFSAYEAFVDEAIEQ